MALGSGFWPEGFWPDDFWQDDYWPDLPPVTVAPATEPPPDVHRRGIRNFGFSMRDSWR